MIYISTLTIPYVQSVKLVETTKAWQKTSSTTNFSVIHTRRHFGSMDRVRKACNIAAVARTHSCVVEKVANAFWH